MLNASARKHTSPAHQLSRTNYRRYPAEALTTSCSTAPAAAANHILTLLWHGLHSSTQTAEKLQIAWLHELQNVTYASTAWYSTSRSPSAT
ncbi:MAG UNVERIFIED_CONTAM: hypothetical protein LVR18_48245, partial [Planctomycetaceae bacterium]